MITHKKGKAAVTHYKLLEALGPYSLVQFQIQTGRTHQIRVHMQHIGHSIVCDPYYMVMHNRFLFLHSKENINYQNQKKKKNRYYIAWDSRATIKIQMPMEMNIHLKQGCQKI